jgi:riboflavin synthase
LYLPFVFFVSQSLILVVVVILGRLHFVQLMVYENEAERKRKLMAVVILTKEHYLHGSFALFQSVLKLTGFFVGDQPHCT